MRKVSLISAAILLLMVLGVSVNMFFVGEPVDAEQLAWEITEQGSQLEVSVDAMDSACALRGWKMQQEGSIMYIQVRKVLVSPFFASGHEDLILDTAQLSKIYLGGKQIWSSS